jgi:methionine synthase I (cobalamin-dependent)
MATVSLKVSYNSLGDTVLSFSHEEKSYNMYQYNCSGARELLKRVEYFVQCGFNVFVIEDVFSCINVTPAVEYIGNIIKLDNELKVMSHLFHDNNSRGAEICGHYGY